MTVTIENLYTGNGSTTDYSFTFPYLDTTDIKVTLATVATTAYSLLNATTVRFDSAPGNGVAIRIYRETAFDTPKATFYPGSAIRANDLNDNTLQNLYVNQESNDKVADAWLTGDPTVISTESWYTTDDTKIASTKAIENRISAKIDTAMEADVLAGTDLTKTASGGQVTINHSVTGASSVNNSNGVVLQDLTINGRGHVTSTGSVDLDGRYYRETELDAGQLDNRYYTETETGTLIDNKIDTALGSDVLAGQSITKNASGGQVTISIANGAIGADQIAADAVGASELADNAVASANIIDGSIVNADINASADIAGSKLADDSVTLAKLGSGALPTDITIASANIVNGTIVDADIATGTLDNRYFTETELTGGALDGRYYTETESDARYFNISTGDTIKDGDTFPDNDTTIATTAAINDRIIDLVDDVGGFVPIANETSFPNANPDVNNGAGTLVSIKALSSNLTSNGSGVATISNGTVGNSTVTINGLANSTTYAATFGMIVETTTTLNTYTFHRLVPKATEVTTVAGSISNVNTVAGDISNVNAVAGNATNINAVAGNNSNITAVAGNASNINSAVSNASNINSAVSNASNINSAVSNASNITAVAGSISNVNTVATNISNVNDFSDKYRVASSAPTSSLDTGDLYFDTSANELKVYNGSAWQGGVTATGNLAGLGANTFTGNQSLGDNLKVQLGTGNDLQLYHNGSHSFITTSTGNLKLEAASHIQLSPANGEDGIQAVANGAVELYYDNSKKLETASWGVRVTGWLGLLDSQKAVFGDGDDLQIYHSGSHSIIKNTTGNLILQDDSNVVIEKTDGENMIVTTGDGSVDLYYDGVKKFQTASNGTKTTGLYHLVSNPGAAAYIEVGQGATDNQYAYLDLVGDTTYSDYGLRLIRGNSGANTNSDLKHRGTGALNIQCVDSAELRFLTNSTTRWRIESGGDLRNASDSYKLKLGAGDDLTLFHDGSNAYITNTTGTIHIMGKSGENSIQAQPNGAVELYYDNVKKFETTSGGAKVTGTLEVTEDFVTTMANGYDFWIDRSASKIRVGDGIQFQYGNAGDLQIYHNGTDSFITNNTGILNINNNDIRFKTSGDESSLRAIANGAVELMYDNSKKLNTYSGGVSVSGSLIVSSELNLVGGSDAAKFLDTQVGTNSFHIRKVTGGDAGHEVMAHFKGDGESALYYDASKKVETYSDGIKVTGAVDFQNNELIASYADANNIDHIWHDDSANAWNFCSDTSARAAGNSKVKCGSVEDSKGDLRSIPKVDKTSAHTLVAADAGKSILITTGGVTIPSTTFAAGDAVTIVNHSGSDQTITQGGSVTLYNTADASTGNRTLAGRGMATIWFASTNVCYISGAGLS